MIVHVHVLGYCFDVQSKDMLSTVTFVGTRIRYPLQLPLNNPVNNYDPDIRAKCIDEEFPLDLLLYFHTKNLESYFVRLQSLQDV